MSLIFTIVLLGFGVWCLKWLSGQVPGVGRMSGFGGRLFGFLFDREKKLGARFQSERESSRFLNARNKGLILDGAGKKRLGERESYEHVAIISPTGGGKTTRYVAPNLLTLDDCSIVVTDPSGELYQKTSGAMAQRGFRVQVLNLENPACSLGYNPVAKANTFDDIDALAQVLMQSSTSEIRPGDEIWYSEPQNLFAILIRCLKNTGEPEWINLHNLLHLLENFGKGGQGLFAFVKRYAPDDKTFSQFIGFISSNEKMLSSFTTMGRNALQVLNNPEMASLLSRDELDFDTLRQQKTVLYIVVPSKKLKLYSPLLNLFYTQFFAAQDNLAYMNEGLPIHVLYDEFGHSRIPDFDTIATTIRKYRVSLSIILQDYSQLKKQYGDHAAKTILAGGIRTKMFYSGLDIETATMVEKMLGKVQYEYKKGGHESWREANLMNADRISRMEKGQALCVTANEEPVLIQTTPCFENPRLHAMMQITPHPLPSPLPTNNLRFVPLS